MVYRGKIYTAVIIKWYSEANSHRYILTLGELTLCLPQLGPQTLDLTTSLEFQLWSAFNN